MSVNALPRGQGTRTFSGSRAVFLFNNTVVGWASGVDGSEEIMYEPVDVINRLEVAEHVPVGYRVTLRCRVFRTIARGDSITEENPGSLKAMGLFPRLDQILRIEGVTAALIDSVTGKVIFQVQGCKTSQYSFDAAARGLVAQDVQFVAIKARDESEVKGATVTQAA